MIVFYESEDGLRIVANQGFVWFENEHGHEFVASDEHADEIWTLYDENRISEFGSILPADVQQYDDAFLQAIIDQVPSNEKDVTIA